MAATKFKVGDRVRVRKWDDMAKEYRVDIDGDIIISGVNEFVSSMRKYCGKATTIASVRSFSYTLNHDEDGWSFTDEMLEPITPAHTWYVGQEVWDDVLHPGETGRITHIESNGSIIVDFNNVPCYYTFDSIYFRFLSAVPYTFSLPPQPEPVWIPEKWERVLVRDHSEGKWWAMAFDRYENGIYYAGQPDISWKFCIPFDEDKVGKV